MSAVESPTFRSFEIRPLLGEPVGQLIGDLTVVGIPDHVVEEGHAPETREGGAAGDLGHSARLLEAFRADDNLLAHSLFSQIMKATSVSVRTKNGRKFPAFVGFRAKEQAGHEQTGYALEVNFLHGEARALDFTVDDCIQGGFFRHRPKAVCHEEAQFELLRPGLPSLAGCGWFEREKAVEIFELSGS